MKQYFETDKWQPIIEKVTDILRIATCIIDPEGNPLLFHLKIDMDGGLIRIF